MNRVIKFRGKRIDDGKWIYGMLENIEKSYGYAQIDSDDTADIVSIDTVGQFTGLYDKNGTEIYEGDILRLPPKNGFEEKNFVSFEVFWHDNDDACYHIGWQINRLHYNGCICGYEMGVINFLPKWTSKMVVIGSIHDNPELLKGGNNE